MKYFDRLAASFGESSIAFLKGEGKSPKKEFKAIDHEANVVSQYFLFARAFEESMA